jgi:hypothetical protein
MRSFCGSTSQWSTSTALAIAAVLSFCGTVAHAASLVEVTLTARLDEPRGYCLDVVGFQNRAIPARGLQAHTCYSYQERLAPDQAFDAERIVAGEFRLPVFNVCMTLTSPREGAVLALSACDGRLAQRFDLTPDGRVVPQDAASLCLTVADGAPSTGGGGNPVHVYRRLTTEPCADSRAAYQTWRLRTRADSGP